MISTLTLTVSLAQGFLSDKERFDSVVYTERIITGILHNWEQWFAEKKVCGEGCDLGHWPWASTISLYGGGHAVK